MLKILAGPTYKLFGVQATREIEARLYKRIPPHTLMQQAGIKVAGLAMAVKPHGNVFWIACGPGNNGGDGMETALILKSWGKTPVVSWLGSPDTAPPEALLSFKRCCQAGIAVNGPPPKSFEFCIDALLGIGSTRLVDGEMADWVNQINASKVPVLSIDLPSGLNGDTGTFSGVSVRADLTLSLLTIKPGLFTASGRDASGEVWFDPLVEPALDSPVVPSAMLLGGATALPRPHATHKGDYGDVSVIGGAKGMTGAALLAATAALHFGAGRVFVGLLDGQTLEADNSQAELMFRPVESLLNDSSTLVCGCGGALSIGACLPKIISVTSKVVIDADALNCVAQDEELQKMLKLRKSRGHHTVLTPHPLEAARLLGTQAAVVQNNRILAAKQLSERFECTVVLKGSGTVISSPDQTSHINPTGNARLACAGTGDVLAGMIGARMASGLPAFTAACQSVFLHGQMADQWPEGQTLTASALATRL